MVVVLKVNNGLKGNALLDSGVRLRISIKVSGTGK